MNNLIKLYAIPKQKISIKVANIIKKIIKENSLFCFLVNNKKILLIFFQKKNLLFSQFFFVVSFLN